MTQNTGIDTAVRRVVRDPSSNYWHSMKKTALLLFSFKMCMGGGVRGVEADYSHVESDTRLHIHSFSTFYECDFTL